MKTELNSKDYVSFARRFVKETVENMDAKNSKTLQSQHYMRTYKKCMMT